MSLTESKPVETGSKAPDFTLLNTIDNQEYSLQDLKGKQGTVIVFSCNHCPFVKHINQELVAVAKKYQKKGIQFIAISSNDVENYPQDGPAKMKEVAKEEAYPFPYLYDESQQVAKDYNAACTPDFYLFDDDLRLAYHGRFDASRPGNDVAVTGKDLVDAMEALLDNQPLLEQQLPSMGCNIKWK